MVGNAGIGKTRIMQKCRASINDQFKHYKPEDERKLRELKVKNDATLEKLKRIYLAYSSECTPNAIINPKEDLYGDAMKMIWKEIRKYSSEDITNFSIALGSPGMDSYIGEGGTGLFLSALINRCNDSDFTVITNHLDKYIPNLGNKNEKRIVIKGSVGMCLGKENQGEIIVEGDTKGWAGHLMGERGILIIKGNAGSKVGYNSSGTIYLEGDYDSIGPYLTGSIYHKGKLIAQFDHETAEKYLKDVREGRNPPDSARPKVKIFGYGVRYCGIVANGVVINDGIDKY